MLAAISDARVDGTSAGPLGTGVYTPAGSTLSFVASLTGDGKKAAVRAIHVEVDTPRNTREIPFDPSGLAHVALSTANLAIGAHTIAFAFLDRANVLHAARKAGLFLVVSPSVRVPALTSAQPAPGQIDIVDLADSTAPARPAGLIVPPTQAVLVEGWTFDAAGKAPSKAVYIIIDGKRAFRATVSVPRGDVAQFFKNSAYANSGYAAIVPASELGAGSHTISIVINGKNGSTNGLGMTAQFTVPAS